MKTWYKIRDLFFFFFPVAFVGGGGGRVSAKVSVVVDDGDRDQLVNAKKKMA